MRQPEPTDRFVQWLQTALVGPAPGVLDPTVQRRMRVLSGVSLPLLAFSALEVVATPSAGRLVALLAFCAIAVAYALSRSTWTTAPPWLLTAATALVPYYGLFTPEATTSAVSEQAWALLLPAIAGLALPTRTVFLLCGLHVGIVATATLLNGAIPLQAGIQLSASVALFSTCTVVAASVREGHQDALSARTEELRTTGIDLARAKALSENTVASMADGLLIADGSRTIRAANPAFCTALDYAEKELVGQPLDFVLTNESDDTALFEAPLKDRAGNDGIRSVEAVFRTRAGDDLPMSCKVTYLKEPRDLAFGLVILARDMRETHRVISAAAEAEAHRRKAKEIQVAHDKLLQTQSQLVQAGKLAALGELAGAVAHEVNNPLGAALLATDLALEALDEAEPEPELTRKQLVLIQDAIQRCQSVINGLLDFGRQSSGVTEALDLGEVVRSALALTSRKLMVSGANVVVDLPLPLPVIGDRNQLGQVVLNLVLNASQALDGQGTIEIRGALQGQEVRLSIRDDGCGIDPFVAQRIFEPFFTTKPRGQGTGLGLSITYGIVTEHGGWIDVQSEPGNGATFTLVLPRSEGFTP